MALRNITFKKTNIGGNTGAYFISIDSPRTLLASNVTRAQLEAGYTINDVDTIHTVFIISSTSSLCNNSVYVTIPYTPPPDTTAPSVPIGFGINYFPSDITLNWNASTDNIGVTGYNIERKINDGAFSSIDNTTSLSYVDYGVFADTTYTYRIRAFDAAGNFSGYSAEAGVYTL